MLFRSYSTFIGYQAGYNSNWNSGGTAGANTCVGALSGYNLTTGRYNNFFGSGVNASGYEVTTGSKNTILDSYSGNQGGLDIRTASGYIVLSDGDGTPRLFSDGSGHIIIGDTTTPSGAGNTQFYVKNTTSDYVMFASNSNASPVGNIIKYTAATPNNTGNEFLTCADSSANRLVIRSNEIGRAHV